MIPAHVVSRVSRPSAVKATTLQRKWQARDMHESHRSQNQWNLQTWRTMVCCLRTKIIVVRI